MSKQGKKGKQGKKSKVFLHDGSTLPESAKPMPGMIASRSRMDHYGLGFQLPNPDLILRKMGKSVAVYNELLKHPVVAGLVRRRRASVNKRIFSLDEASFVGDARVMTATKQMLAGLNQREIIKSMVGGALFGYQPLEMMWGVDGAQFALTDIVAKPPAWFFFDHDNQLRLRTKDDVTNGEACEPSKFILARQNNTYDNPYGEADLALCFWAVTFMRAGFKWWVDLCQKYGMPKLIGKLPRNSQQSDYDDLADQLDAMVEDAVAVIANDASVEFLKEEKSASSPVFKDLLMYCRSEISIALVGQNATTEANGTDASANAGAEVTDDIADNDAAMVCAAYQQAINQYVWFNFGCPPAQAPKCQLLPREQIDQQRADRDVKLTHAGAKFTSAYFVRQYNLQPGDLEQPVATRPVADLTFAEPTEQDISEVIDEAVQAYLATTLPGVTQAMIGPLIAAIRDTADPDAQMDKLAELLPLMDDTLLRKTLANVMFAVDVIGRLMVQAELADG